MMCVRERTELSFYSQSVGIRIVTNMLKWRVSVLLFLCVVFNFGSGMQIDFTNSKNLGRGFIGPMVNMLTKLSLGIEESIDEIDVLRGDVLSAKEVGSWTNTSCRPYSIWQNISNTMEELQAKFSNEDTCSELGHALQTLAAQRTGILNHLEVLADQWKESSEILPIPSALVSSYIQFR